MTYFAKNLFKDKHCFFGKKGGVSKGIYEGLNVNHKGLDDEADLAKNFAIVASKFGLEPQNLHLLNQGVSADVCYVTSTSQHQVQADGAVTDQKGVVLTIRTADCAPVLMADYENGIIGAAHAGWRGAFKGVVENTLKLMLEKGAKLENICAAVGPCIGQASYEVDNGFYELFLKENPSFGKYFENGKKQGFYQFDLEEFVKDKLINFGVKSISVSGLDTYVLVDEYYSFRRNTHLGIIRSHGDFPTEISAITL